MSLLNHFPVGHKYACICCRSLKHQWAYAGYPKGSPINLECFKTPLRPLLDLLESELDLVYDPLHCVALVLRHMVFHALYLWVQEHALDKLDRFHTLLSEHLEEWRAPVAEGPQHHEFSISCVSAKQVLKMKNCGMV